MSINAGSVVAYLELDYSKYTAGLTTARQQLSTFADNTQSAGTRIEALGSVITGVGTTLTKGLTVPLVGAGAASLTVAANFEEGMSKVQAISGASASDMEKLSAKAKEMGANTKFSATESAEAFQYMAMAGWGTTDMLDGISGVMNLAAASGENLGLVSDIVTDAITAFGLSANDSGHFADVLAAASNNANTNVSMLGESFKYIAPVAGAMNYSIEETAVALGIMANNGIKASQAGTSLRSALSHLLKPTDTVAGALKKVGLWIDRDEEGLEALNLAIMNSDGTSKTLTETMDTLRDAFKDLDEAQRTQIAAQVFGTEAMSGMLSIINTSEADYKKLTEAINNADGTAQRMAETMGNNLKGNITLFKSALEGAGIAIGENLLPAMTGIVQKATSVVSAFGQLDKETQKTIVNTGLVVAAIGPLITIGGKLISGIGAVSSALSSMGGTMAVLAGPVGWIGLAAVAVGTLTTAFVVNQKELNKSTEGFKDACDNLESFEGKVRSADSWWTRVFGKEVKIEYSVEFNEDKQVIEDYNNGILSSIEKYYKDKWNIDHDGCLDEEEHQAHLQEIRNTSFQNMKDSLHNSRKEIGESTKQANDEMKEYLTNTLDYSNETVQTVMSGYEEWSSELRSKYTSNLSEIEEIYSTSMDSQGNLTKDGQERINEIMEENSKIQTQLTAGGCEDRYNSYLQEYEKKGVVLKVSGDNEIELMKSLRKNIEEYTDSYEKEIDKQIEAVKKNSLLNDQEKERELSRLEGKKEAMRNFTLSYDSNVRDLVTSGESFSDASTKSFDKFVNNLKNGSINAEDFGMKIEEMMGEAILAMSSAGMSTDDLTAAIKKVPRNKRADVIAYVSGKSDADNLKNSIDALQNKTVYVDVNVKNNQVGWSNYVGVGPYGSYATGTINAIGGLAQVAEYGPELIVSRDNASAYLATDRKFMNLNDGDVVYNARQTQEILNSMSNNNSLNKNTASIEGLLKEVSSKLDYLKDIANKEFNKITENIFEKVDVNGVTDIEDIAYKLIEYVEDRNYGVR